MTDLPYRYGVTNAAGPLHERFGGLPAGEETDIHVAVAGRLMLHRRQGKLAFATLRDSSGSIQLFAGAGHTDRFEEFTKLSLGDWIGASGTVMRTRRGELSVKVADWTLLAEARRGFGDKWRGVSDVDTRYRQRYVDLWANEESARVFRQRSRMVSLTRRFLEDTGFVEVETPTFHSTPSGGHAQPFVTHHKALDLDLYLRIAPELYLKRLVVGGFERVFEVARVFRNEGLSPRHNPEFTMLEAYQAYADYGDMMSLVEQLVSHLAVELNGSTIVEFDGRPIDLTAPWRRATMDELVSERIGEPVSLEMGRDALADVARRHDVPVQNGWGAGKLLLEIYEKTTETSLWGPVFVCDYPEEVSPLARSHRSRPGYVERFEGIIAGRELCNAFTELTDPDEQRARFEAQAAARAAGDEDAMAIDEEYVRALEYGLPPTAGLGIGLDRLAMILTGVTTIRDVVLFPTLRPEGTGSAER